MSDKVTLKIPKPLYDKLKSIIENTGYSSVTEFVVFVLRDLVSSEEIQQTTKNNKSTNQIETLTEEEIKAIKKRLKNLGYLDD
jgi:metal-responsive CopG/Arc/MetJ family transcriptional regulator